MIPEEKADNGKEGKSILREVACGVPYDRIDRKDIFMTTFLIVVAIAAAVYLFAAISFYYGFKNWNPMCGGKSARCGSGESCSNSPATSGSTRSLQ